jgi:mono/diheme cytochrome c family protein
MHVRRILVFIVLAGSVLACAPETHTTAPAWHEPWKQGAYLAPEKQQLGDPELGRYLLLNGDFMTCGVPYRLWEDSLLGNMVQNQLTATLGGGADAPRISGREGKNADMPFFLNTFTAPNGAEVINANCLSCHGGMFDGEMVLGLGNATADYTNLSGGGASGLPLNDELLALLGLDEAERENMLKIASRAGKLTGSSMRTVGMNPAEMMAVILAAHHDQETLAWSDDILIPPVVLDHAGNIIEDPLVTSDPPPWWRVHKKNALFYNGMARGDHRGTMALATSVCVEDLERAAEVDEMFLHIQAFVSSIRAPKYKRTIDAPLAAEGETLYLRDCAGCHGTYGANEADHTYPNLLIPLNVIGTDPVVAEAGVVHAPAMVEWYNASFYGGITRMQPGDPFAGYMPPPLDGIWATAPFFHNGSVPTVELVLNSKARPKYWKRVDYDSQNFDEAALGWPFIEVAYPQAEAREDERKHIYDTTYWSQSNKGHTFGDHLTPIQRRAVIEYLKTL